MVLAVAKRAAGEEAVGLGAHDEIVQHKWQAVRGRSLREPTTSG